MFLSLHPYTTRAALTATLELSVELTMQAYKAGRIGEPLDQWLWENLGVNLVTPPCPSDVDASSTPSTSSSSMSTMPARMLHNVLRDSNVDGANDVDAAELAMFLRYELSERLMRRRMALRERRVCIAWRNTPTNLSTMARACVFDISTMLALTEDEFGSRLADLDRAGASPAESHNEWQN